MFNTTNIEALALACKKTDALLSQHCDGALMLSQMQFLSELIKEYINNPIVKSSGILPIK